MYHWLRRDDEMARVCGFTRDELTADAEAARVADLQREVGLSGDAPHRPAEGDAVLGALRLDRSGSVLGATARSPARGHPLSARGHWRCGHAPCRRRSRRGRDGCAPASADRRDRSRTADRAPDSSVSCSPPSNSSARRDTDPRTAGGAVTPATSTWRAGSRPSAGSRSTRSPGIRQVRSTPCRWWPSGTTATWRWAPVPPASVTSSTSHGPCIPVATSGPERLPQSGFACWPAVPLQTNFDLDIAGQRYCVIFNGWYVDEEIAANLLDPRRYDWLERIGAVLHTPDELEHLRRTDRLDEYRTAQIEIATLRAVRLGFKAARRRLNSVGPSQAAFGKFHERYLAVHGDAPPNDTGWTANRFGSITGMRAIRCRTSNSVRGPPCCVTG